MEICRDCNGTGAGMGIGTSGLKGMCEYCGGSGEVEGEKI